MILDNKRIEPLFFLWFWKVKFNSGRWNFYREGQGQPLISHFVLADCSKHLLIALQKEFHSYSLLEITHKIAPHAIHAAMVWCRLTFSVLQTTNCVSGPHSFPFPDLGGSPHVRVCFWAPVPQVLEQDPSSFQLVHPQSTSHYKGHKKLYQLCCTANWKRWFCYARQVWSITMATYLWKKITK